MWLGPGNDWWYSARSRLVGHVWPYSQTRPPPFLLLVHLFLVCLYLIPNIVYLNDTQAEMPSMSDELGMRTSCTHPFPLQWLFSVVLSCISPRSARGMGGCWVMGFCFNPFPQHACSKLVWIKPNNILAWEHGALLSQTHWGFLPTAFFPVMTPTKKQWQKLCFMLSAHRNGRYEDRVTTTIAYVNCMCKTV